MKNESGLAKQTAQPSHEFKPYMVVGEKHDIKITALPDNATAH